MDKKTFAHTVWECKYHIVFAPKYRRQIIYGKIKTDVGSISDLAYFIMDRLDISNVILGSGGMRKIRWEIPGKGKRGGIRVLYVDFVVVEKIYMLDLYAKNEKANLSKSEIAEYKTIITALKEAIKNGKT